MSRLIAALIRHGDYHQLPDTPSAHQPFGLNVDGEQQAIDGASLLATTIAEHDWALSPIVDSSRLLRAWQTARLMIDGLGGRLAIEEFDQLAERSVGIAANLSISRIEQVLADDPRYPSPPPGWKANSHYQLPLPGAESLLEAGRRVAGHLSARLSDLPRNGKQNRVKLFVGHGASFRHAAYHLGVLKFEQLAELSMYHARPVFLEMGADGSWAHVAGKWKRRRPLETFKD